MTSITSANHTTAPMPSPAVPLMGAGALPLALSLLLVTGCAQNPAAPTASAAAPATSAAAPAAPAPAWQQGRSVELANSTLAPVAGKLTITPPADIPLDKLKLPAGFKAELWAHGMPGARDMVRATNGKYYVGTRGIGRVYEITDNGAARTSRVVVDKLNQPSGVVMLGNTLYVFSVEKVLRFDNVATNPSVPAVDMTDTFKLPVGNHHNWKYVAQGPDGKLYVPFGAPCNICEPGKDFAQIRRYNPDGSGSELVASGVRNSVGFDWHPVTQEMWFTDHGRDWMGDNGPEDELNRLSAVGQNFGFPYCHANGIADPDVKKANACNGVTLPVATMGPHAAVMGIRFYTGTMFPADYKNVAFVARKGSWNRTQKYGYDVVTVKADADGKNPKITPFLTGFLGDNNSFTGRPAYITQHTDGSLLISDEQLGAIYRISYAR